MMRHRLRLAALLVLVAAVAATTASGRDTREGVSGTISIIGKWTGDEQKSFQAVLDAFKKKNPDVSIKYTAAGDNVPQIVATAVQGGNPPNLATLPQPGTMRDFARRGALEPITSVRSVIARNYAPVWLSLGSVGGKLYGLFFKGANKSTVWYNVAALRDAGVKPPRSWPQLLKAAATIKASGLPAFSIGGADGWTLTDLFENVYLRTAGPNRYDQLADHKLKWTHPSVKRALRLMAEALSDGANIAGGRQGALQTDFPTSVSNVLTSKPKAAMVIEGDFVPGVVATSTDLKPIAGYNQFAFPSINGSKPMVMGGGDIVVMFRSNPAAEALLRYLARPEAATIWARRGGFSSPNRNVKPGAYRDPTSRATALALARASVFRFDLSDLQPASFGSTTGQGMWKLFQDFLQSPQNVDGIASQLEAAAAKAHGK